MPMSVSRMSFERICSALVAQGGFVLMRLAYRGHTWAARCHGLFRYDKESAVRTTFGSRLLNEETTSWLESTSGKFARDSFAEDAAEVVLKRSKFGKPLCDKAAGRRMR